MAMTRICVYSFGEYHIEQTKTDAKHTTKTALLFESKTRQDIYLHFCLTDIFCFCIFFLFRTYYKYLCSFKVVTSGTYNAVVGSIVVVAALCQEFLQQLLHKKRKLRKIVVLTLLLRKGNFSLYC